MSAEVIATLVADFESVFAEALAALIEAAKARANEPE